MSGWFVRGLLLSGWKPYTLEDQKRDERAARAKKKLAAERKAARKKK